MHRSRPTAMAVFILAGTLAGCSSSPEEELISNFFRAARMRDNTTLANISMAAFSPLERGTVQSFDVEGVAEQTRRPMRARALGEALGEAQAAETEFSERKQVYQDENLEAIERVVAAEREGNTLRRRADRTVQESWTQWREERAQHAQNVSEARAQLSEERVVADGSTFDPAAADMIDVTQYDGEIATVRVRILAQVQTPDGQDAQQTLDVAIERAELVGDDGTPLNGRWLITAIEEVG